jgi:beta-glucanase (GH16 family)
MIKFSPILLIFFLFVISSGCSTDEADTTPVDLNIEITIGDSKSGSVTFKATALNATGFDFDFGDGSMHGSSDSGLISYKYFASGSYNVVVTASNKSGESVSKTVTVTIDVQLSQVWSDEFSVDGMPDPSKWVFELGAGGWGNNEAEYYTNRKENALVSNGTLKIVAQKESFSGSQYTSARLVTKDKYSFTYGKVEVRAKVPAGIGTWPAVWMLGNNISTIGWPACGEIDIMEHRGSELNKIFGTLHYTGRSGGNANGNTKFVSTASTEFHVYTLEWAPNFIKISADGTVYHSIFNNNDLPFNRDFFLIMNLAVGGNFAGPIDQAFTSAVFEIDYIRVYR